MASTPPVLLAPLDRVLIRASGADRHDFFHRVCSQDVLGMAEGEARTATLLTAKGKVASLFVLWKLPDALLLEVEAAHAAGLLAGLDRYLFSEQVQLSSLADQVAGLGIFGAEAAGTAATLVGGRAPADWTRAGWLGPDGQRAAAPARGLGVAGLVLYLPAAERQAALARGLPQAAGAELERWRIAAGIPRFGVDTDASTFPQEANLDAAVSTTKGCYVGQEVVARIHTYGHVNRRLVRLAIARPEPPASGASLFAEGEPVGRITSTVAPGLGGGVEALGYVPRVLAAPGEQLALAAAGAPEATVLTLEGAP